MEEILPRVTLTADIKDLQSGFFTQRASDDMEAGFRKLMLDQPPLGQFAELQPPKGRPPLAGPCANPNCGAEETSDWRSGPGAHPILPHTLTCSVSHYPLEAHLYVAPSSVRETLLGR